jgi:hypothetical protein
MTHTTTFYRILGIAVTLASAACGGGGSSQGDDESPQCAAGEPACTCLPGGTCAAGLACVDQRCQVPGEVGISVSDASACSCEVLLRARASQIVGASFGDAATGVHVQEGDHTALSFFASTDQPIPDSAMSLHVVERGDTSGIEVARARCFDRDGAVIAGAGVDLRR